MPIRRSATRLAVVGLLTAAGGLALGADQFGALAQRLEDALQADAPDATGDADPDPADETAAERAEDDGYPLGRSGDLKSP
jgi:hypothetical protein